MNIDKATHDITHAIIDHFRSKTSGNGYFYLDEEWAISKIVEKHLKANQRKVWNVTDDPINIGDEVLLVDDGYAASRCANAMVIAPLYDVPSDMIFVEWDRKNPNHHGQMDGPYYKHIFKKIVDAKTQS